MNWMRLQRTNSTQGRNRSSLGSHKSNYSSHLSCGSPGNFGRSFRRTGGLPNDSPSNLEHSRFASPCSRQVAKLRSALIEKFQWDRQFSSFRQYKSTITEHLLQVGGACLVNFSFHILYTIMHRMVKFT